MIITNSLSPSWLGCSTFPCLRVCTIFNPGGRCSCCTCYITGWGVGGADQTGPWAPKISLFHCCESRDGPAGGGGPLPAWGRGHKSATCLFNAPSRHQSTAAPKQRRRHALQVVVRTKPKQGSEDTHDPHPAASFTDTKLHLPPSPHHPQHSPPPPHPPTQPHTPVRGPRKTGLNMSEAPIRPQRPQGEGRGHSLVMTVTPPPTNCCPKAPLGGGGGGFASWDLVAPPEASSASSNGWAAAEGRQLAQGPGDWGPPSVAACAHRRRVGRWAPAQCQPVALPLRRCASRRCVERNARANRCTITIPENTGEGEGVARGGGAGAGQCTALPFGGRVHMRRADRNTEELGAARVGGGGAGVLLEGGAGQAESNGGPVPSPCVTCSIQRVCVCVWEGGGLRMPPPPNHPQTQSPTHAPGGGGAQRHDKIVKKKSSAQLMSPNVPQPMDGWLPPQQPPPPPPLRTVARRAESVYGGGIRSISTA